MTVKEGLAKIREILLNPKYPQVRNVLAQFNDKGEVVGKCAYGEMACQLGLIKTNLDYHTSGIYDLVDHALGFPEWIIGGGLLPRITRINGHMTVIPCFDDDDGKQSIGTHLMGWITSLNDGGFTYEEIIEFLETTLGDLDE